MNFKGSGKWLKLVFRLVYNREVLFMYSLLHTGEVMKYIPPAPISLTLAYDITQKFFDSNGSY